LVVIGPEEFGIYKEDNIRIKMGAGRLCLPAPILIFVYFSAFQFSPSIFRIPNFGF